MRNHWSLYIWWTCHNGVCLQALLSSCNGVFKVRVHIALFSGLFIGVHREQAINIDQVSDSFLNMQQQLLHIICKWWKHGTPNVNTYHIVHVWLWYSWFDEINGKYYWWSLYPVSLVSGSILRLINLINFGAGVFSYYQVNVYLHCVN